MASAGSEHDHLNIPGPQAGSTLAGDESLTESTTKGEGHISPCKRLSRPKLSKIFLHPRHKKRRDSPAFASVPEFKFRPELAAISGDEEEEYALLPEERRRSYEKVAQLNRSLMQLNVHRFKMETRRAISIDPSAVVDSAASVGFHHPFEHAQKKFSEGHPASVLEVRHPGYVVTPVPPVPLLPAKAFVSARQRMHSLIPEISPEQEAHASTALWSPCPESTGKSVLGENNLPPQKSSSLHPLTTKVSGDSSGSRSAWQSSSGSRGPGSVTLDRTLSPQKSSPLHPLTAKLSGDSSGSRLIGQSSSSSRGPGSVTSVRTLSPHMMFDPETTRSTSQLTHKRSSQGRSLADRRDTPYALKICPEVVDPGWTPELQEQYVLFNQLQTPRPRRRSIVCRSKWKKAVNIIRIIRHLCRIIAVTSREKEAHLKTFADIGDQAAEDTVNEKGLSFFDSPFKTKKSEPGELTLSTKVQVLMYHPPESRTTDEITLILCDLQCFPSFCSYPLAVQNKIARCGMFMPVGKRRVIVRQGHEAQNWYFVISGQAIETEMIVQEDGAQIQNTVKFITQGMTIAEDAILKNEPQPYTVTTRKNMQLISMYRTHFIEVCHRIRQHSDDVPDHILYMKQQPFMKYFPLELLLKHPSMCCQYYCRPNTVLVTDSVESDCIYVIHSGSCVVQMYVESTKASWKDLELALSHPQVNVNGLPAPSTDTGPGKMPLSQTAYTLYQRMSAQDILASDLNQVPALHMTRSGSKNVRHGLHLLTDGTVSRIKCPWPLDFFEAINRTAFTITLSPRHFPIDPNKQSLEEQNPLVSVDFSSGHSHSKIDAPPEARKQSGETGRFKKRVTTSKRGKADSDSTNENANAVPRQEKTNKGDIPTSEKDTKDKCVFLTAMEDQADDRGGDRKSTKLTPMPSHESCLTQSENKTDTEGSEQGAKTSAKKHSFRRSKNVKLPSCWERRKQYVVPNHCKPPAPHVHWKKDDHPYECTSPPVYIHIDILTEGDSFGLDQLQEPGWERRDQSGRVALISRGAEVVTLNKRFFMSFADDKTHVAIREHMHIYPTRQAVQTRYRLQLAWDLYSRKVRDEFDQQMRAQGKKNLGTFFTDTPIEVGDPYSILKEH